jgi:hypothetical protein
MASIALRNIGCIDYLAYGSIFTRAMFGPKIKDEVFSLPEKCSEPGLGGCAPPPSVVGIVGIHRLVLPGIHWPVFRLVLLCLRSLFF